MSVTAATAKTRTPRGRRTQEERSDTTQRKIIQSALKLLQNKGIRAANLQEIARGARVTLGAVQHHFTNRQVLMERLIDEVMAPLSGDGAVWPSRDLPLDERAHEFVRTCWRTLYGSPNYVAAWSLFYGCKAEPELFARIDQSRAEADPVFFERFIEYFPEIAAVHENPRELASLVFATLRGMGVFQLFNVDSAEVEGQLNMLTKVIVWAGKSGAGDVRRRAKAG
ncbi:TetR/AcrR family transcriptional regulator [Ralstonia syzygii]|uniref:TetR/AcrR family transcriptional regulator n=1 Tax=Ralstonia syzygii TaxID=28097 RepID=UPI0018D10295|nr:TetR/AcrR family transcriptional regulator [Ralstonia syzygii]